MDSDMLDHAENIRYLEVMRILHRKDGFEETRKLAQYWKSRLRITVNELPEEKGESFHYEEVSVAT